MSFAKLAADYLTEEDDAAGESKPKNSRLRAILWTLLGTGAVAGLGALAWKHRGALAELGGGTTKDDTDETKDGPNFYVQNAPTIGMLGGVALGGREAASHAANLGSRYLRGARLADIPELDAGQRPKLQADMRAARFHALPDDVKDTIRRMYSHSTEPASIRSRLKSVLGRITGRATATTPAPAASGQRPLPRGTRLQDIADQLGDTDRARYLLGVQQKNRADLDLLRHRVQSGLRSVATGDTHYVKQRGRGGMALSLIRPGIYGLLGRYAGSGINWAATGGVNDVAERAARAAADQVITGGEP